MSKARQAADEVNRQQAGRRNLFINGAMQVAQRGTSTTGITAAGYYGADRWKMVIGSLGTWTATQDTNAPDGFKNSFKIVPTTADASPASGDYAQFEQKLEAQDTEHLKYGTSDAKSITFSFWVKSNKTGTYNLRLYRIVDSTRMASKSYTIDSADTWEYKTITFAGDTSVAMTGTNGPGLIVSWWLAGGSNFTGGSSQPNWGSYSAANEAPSQVNLADSTSNYWQITGVQLEVGDVATPFEHRSYGEELALCQRYFNVWKAEQNSDAVVTVALHTSTRAFGQYVHPVTMRADPSLTSSGSWAVQVGGNLRAGTTQPAINRSMPTVTQIWLDHASGASAGQAGWLKDNNASTAKLEFDAEL